MMSRELRKACDAGSQNPEEVIPWNGLVLPNQDYGEFVRSRLASVVEVWEEEIQGGIADGVVPGASMTIEYQSSRGVMSKVLPTPPVDNQTCCNTLPDGFTGFSPAGSRRMAAIVDAQREFIKTLLIEREQTQTMPMPQGMFPPFRPYHGTSDSNQATSSTQVPQDIPYGQSEMQRPWFPMMYYGYGFPPPPRGP